METQDDSALEILWDESFACLSDKEIFDRVNEALFVGEPSEDSAQFSNFDFLTNTGEMFNGVKTFIACRPAGHVLIFYEFGSGTFGSGSCRIEVFTVVADSFIRWFDEQVKIIEYSGQK